MAFTLKTIAAGAGTLATTRRGRWACTAGAIVSVILGAILGAYAAGRPLLPAWTALGLFLVVIVTSIVIAQLFYTLEGHFEQRARDIKAGVLWETLRGGHVPDAPFTLYLRPFVSTDAISEIKQQFVQVGALHGNAPHLAMGSDRLEFEAQIERAVRPFGQMVALGLPMEHEGAGRILVGDDEWQAAITSLMDHARLIVLLPSPRPGTLWEVDQLLASDRMQKTIIIDPPNAASDRSDYDPVAEWENIRTAFDARGYTLPEDDPDGQLVYFGAAAEPASAARISLDGVPAVRRFVKSILATMAPATAS